MLPFYPFKIFNFSQTVNDHSHYVLFISKSHVASDPISTGNPLWMKRILYLASTHCCKLRHNDVAKSTIYLVNKHAQHHVHQSLTYDANLDFWCDHFWERIQMYLDILHMSLPLLQLELHNRSHCDSLTVHKLFLHVSDKDGSEQTNPNVGKTMQKPNWVISSWWCIYTAQQMVCNKHLQATWPQGLMTSPMEVNFRNGFTK